MATRIELLAPAKDADHGIAAISHGADAVYIGAPLFSARASAGNSIAEVERLCHYAHLYHAHVHVALNTILADSELESARKIIFQLYEAGADALIFQDTGLLQIDLPPIALHASTQCDNRTADKVKFWESIGIQRVILARELSLAQIQEIRQQTSVELETFVHGALCVSYSGQCYMSHACTQRSANRGECAQLCRLPYTLQDAEDQTIRANSHLLSLKDMDRSESLEELIAAGITSLKIEGRLKNIDYVKNITAYYRQRLDAIFEGNRDYRAASSGRVTHLFQPNPQKTFNRGRTDYFLHRREQILVCPDTPKSIGEPIGKVRRMNGGSIEIDTTATLHNGDGLGFVDSNNQLRGFRINKAENQKVTTLEPIAGLAVGMLVFRNYDIEFDKQLRGDSATRKIAVAMRLEACERGFTLTFCDEDGISVSQTFDAQKEIAQKGEAANEQLRRNLSKLGGTPFAAQSVDIATDAPYFLPASVVNEWRRVLCEQLTRTRIRQHPRPIGTTVLRNEAPFPTAIEGALPYSGNVMNSKAAEFYWQHGIREVAWAFERNPLPGAALMTCKHCIKYALGACSKEKGSRKLQEPLFLKSGSYVFRLEFDCAKCEMKVLSADSQ